MTVPLSVFVAAQIGKRAQPQFIAQWATTGKLNGHIEEMYTGHSLVKVFGRQQEAAEVFEEHNDKLYSAGLPGAVHLRHDPAGDDVHRQPQLRAHRGRRRAAGRVRALSIGDVQAFIQYSRQFSQPITQVASMANLLQSGVASAERVFELLDAPEQTPDPATPAAPARSAGAVAFEGVSFRYDPDRAADRGPVAVGRAGPDGRDRRPDRRRQDHAGQPPHAVLRGDRRPDHCSTASTSPTMSRDELREAMGMVLQDTWLFGGTIADNIAYGADNPTP